MLSMTFTLDLKDVTGAPDFLASLSEAFAKLAPYLKGTPAEVAPRAVTPEAVTEDKPAERKPRGRPAAVKEAPAATSVPVVEAVSEAESAATAAPKAEAPSMSKEVKAAATEAASADIEDKDLIVELRRIGNEIIKNKSLGAPVIVEALKAYKAKRYDELTPDQQREMIATLAGKLA
jgi:hypothetical protein